MHLRSDSAAGVRFLASMREGRGIKPSARIDVREANEWSAGHAPQAVHVALGALSPGNVDRDKVVIAACRSGGRSAQATALLQSAGIDVRNLAGGMKAWSAAGLPDCREDGSVGAIT